MIELVYAAGLRVSEAVGLTVTQVKLEAGYLTVTGKGRKERAVPIGKMARARLVAYLRDVRPQILGRRLSPHLFVTRAGHAMSRQSFAAPAAAALQAASAAHQPAHPARLRDAPGRGQLRSTVRAAAVGTPTSAPPRSTRVARERLRRCTKFHPRG
jgi:integrase/recombinase XerD